MGSVVLQETESRHAKVIEMVKAGKTNAEIKEVTGYCRASINKIAKANGINRMNEKHQKVIDLYLNNKTTSEIVMETGYGRPQVYNIIRKHDLREMRDKLPSDEEIVKAYEQIKNWKKVSFELKIPYNYTHSVLKQAGVLKKQSCGRKPKVEVSKEIIFPETEEDIAIKKLIPEKKPIKFERVNVQNKVYADVSALYGI